MMRLLTLCLVATAVRIEDPKKPKAVVKAKESSDEQKIDRFAAGLKALAVVRTSAKAALKGGAVAAGAMEEQLGDDNSAMWNTIGDMLKMAMDAKKQAAGKSKAEQEKIMQSMQGKADAAAEKLKVINKNVDAADMKHNEEFLLGLLLKRTDVPMKEQVAVVKKFADEHCKAAVELLSHYDDKKPLAGQLASLMDKQNIPRAKVFLQTETLAEQFIEFVDENRLI